MLYEKIEELMHQTGVSAYQISKKTKIPQSAFSRWKKGESEPSLKNIKILSEYFGVPIDYFTNDTFIDIQKIKKEVSTKKEDTSNVNLKNVKVMFYGDYELTEQEKKMVENVVKGVISSRKDERNKK